MKIDKRTTAILSLIFGVLILVRPDVLQLLVALFLILYGVMHFIEK